MFISEYKYPLASNTISTGEIDALREWLGTYPKLTKDKLTLEFEEKWAEFIGVKHAVLCNSGSSANLLMYSVLKETLRTTRRPKVVVPAISWATTVAPALQLGFEIHLCDAETDTWGLDPDMLQFILSTNPIDAVMVVNTMGIPAKLHAIRELCQQHGCALLEDSCPSSFSELDGQKLGSFGDMASTSGYAGHPFSVIEAGIVTTDSYDYYNMLLMMRSHGWTKDLSDQASQRLHAKHSPMRFNEIFTFYVPGYNLRSTEIQAFLGLSEMDKIPDMSLARETAYERYTERFMELPDFDIQTPLPGSRVVPISFGVLAPSIRLRDHIGFSLKNYGIETRPWGSIGRQPFWTERFGKASLPQADKIHTRSFLLPVHQDMSTSDVDFIVDAVKEIADVR